MYVVKVKFCFQKSNMNKSIKNKKMRGTKVVKVKVLHAQFALLYSADAFSQEMIVILLNYNQI